MLRSARRVLRRGRAYARVEWARVEWSVVEYSGVRPKGVVYAQQPGPPLNQMIISLSLPEEMSTGVYQK